jgi:putative heme-binding domain-containing protein
MNITQRFLLPALISAIVLTGCNDAGTEKTGNKNDSLYSGTKFNENIRATNAQTPEEERKGFKLPEGFEISLFASEPQIGKPINLTFDPLGHVWVTQSFEYPFPAVPGGGKDRVTILEDTDNDGKADKFTHFDDTLNIPIGVIPTVQGAMVYSIPNVYKFIDKDGDGKPESSQKIMGPFEVKDTHGMVNNFTWGFDGWIHACHGFSNRSNVAALDGDSVHLISGNTIRFKPDGSRVEHETAGRINPFGLTYDELGYLYSTDCHTSPLYQMISGGDYTQWGKDEGMGFAPDMQSFSNEATALAGITYYADNLFPEKYQKTFYVGDVVTSRVYRYSSSWKGASPIGKREEDFILSEDPWFRPVDVKMGPDGAIYIADFYNSIIGHYEVPLDHPKRDRIRGRIWKVTYKGKINEKKDLLKATSEQLFAALNSPNLAERIIATNQLADRIGASSAEPAKAVLAKKDATTTEYVHSLWILQRLHALTDELITTAVSNADPVIRLHALRTIREQKDTSAALYPVIVKALDDKDPHVKRAASEAMSRYVNMQSVEQLVAFRKKLANDDSHSIYTTRLMLRNLLRNEPLMTAAAAKQWSNEDAKVLSTVLVGVETPASGIFMYNYVKNQELPKDELPKAFRHIIRFVPNAQLNDVIATGMDKAKKDKEIESSIFKNLQEGLQRRGAPESVAFKTWGKEIAKSLLAKYKSENGNKERKQEVYDQQFFAAGLAGTYKMNDVSEELIALFRDTTSRDYLRSEALKSLMKIDPAKYAPIAGEVLQNPSTTADFKRGIISALAQFPSKSVENVMAGVKNPSPDLQQVIVWALASTESGKNLLFEKVKKGEVFARTLVDPGTQERLMLNITPAQKKIFDELTANVETIDKEKQGIISGRIADYNNLKEKPSAETGHAVFLKNCAMCHSMNGQGGAIGPNLDGVGKWGVGPLSEKILDPNRNISENFRVYTMKLRDGKVLSGLYRRDEGQVIVFADNSGQEFSISKQDIMERKASKSTLMPSQFINTIKVEEFNALLSFLLSKKS